MSNSQSSSTGPHPLLAGVAAGLTLFALTVCTLGLVLAPMLSSQVRDVATGASSRQTWSAPTPTFTPPPGSTPTISATLTPLSPESGSPAPSNGGTLQVGDTVVNANKGPVNLRKTPGYLGKESKSDRIALVPSGAQLLITGGPQEKDELVWWQVQWKDKEGWMAERTASGVLILKRVE